MPIVFREREFRFHFFSNEGDPREPVHVHVAKRGEDDAKLWLYPEVTFSYEGSFDSRTRQWMLEVVADRRSEIESTWHEHFGGG